MQDLNLEILERKITYLFFENIKRTFNIKQIKYFVGAKIDDRPLYKILNSICRNDYIKEIGRGKYSFNKNKKFEFDPSVYKTRKTLEDYSIYNYNFMFKINKLSARVKRYTVRNFRKYNIGNPELVILSLIGQVKDQLTIKDLTTVHWMDKGFICT